MAWQQDLIQVILSLHMLIICTLMNLLYNQIKVLSTQYTDWKDTQEIKHQARSHFYFKLIYQFIFRLNPLSVKNNAL